MNDSILRGANRGLVHEAFEQLALDENDFKFTEVMIRFNVRNADVLFGMGVSYGTANGRI